MSHQDDRTPTEGTIVAIRKIRDRDDLDAWIARVGRYLQGKAKREAMLEARIARSSQRLDRYRAEQARLSEFDENRLMRAAVAIYAYCAPRRDELTSGKDNTARLGTGILSWRDVPTGALEFTVDEETTIQEIARVAPELFDELVKTEQSIRKTALKQHPDILAMLQTAFVEAGSSFTVAPNNTPRKLTKPIRRLRELAIDAGLID